jgi:toluene monooxygenase system protein A
MLKRDEWLDIARKVDWEYSYVEEKDVFPEDVSGVSSTPSAAWRAWDEPYRTSYREYVKTQYEKETSVNAVRDLIGRVDDFQALDQQWINGLKLHAATLPLAEFDAVIGNLRAARFGRDSAWRTVATFGALDELRHTQIPLRLMHDLVRWEPQFDWTHKFYHTQNWIAIAARHIFDELLLTSNPIEFAIATNVVFETGFTNLQFVGLSALGHLVGDRMFQKMVSSIQTDEARHSQIGPAVLTILLEHDPEYVQTLLDKWFWRSWLLFAIVTGFSMDYLTPLEKRRLSFKEFMEEWILDQYLRMLEEYGMKRPWYWDFFMEELEIYHHMVYASAYSYRATCWFDLGIPSPEERQWLAEKYPRSWNQMEAVWEQMIECWQQNDPGTQWGVHGAAPVAFCNLCQLVLCQGTPQKNMARVVEYQGEKYIFCSEPCACIFEQEPERYAKHKDIVKRILCGEAPANLLELVKHYFQLSPEVWGQDLFKGDYPWMKSNTVQDNRQEE